MAPSPIQPEDLLPAEEYEKRRDALRSEIIALKNLRRVEVGPWVSVVFENRATVLFQIQEMLRIERITEPARVLHEIETYAELLPGPGELSGTLFIEIPDAQERRAALATLGGIETKVSLRVGALRVPAEDKRPIDSQFERPGLAAAVYYLRFPFSPVPRERFLAGKEEVWLGIDHPRYAHAARLAASALGSLSQDLR